MATKGTIAAALLALTAGLTTIVPATPAHATTLGVVSGPFVGQAVMDPGIPLAGPCISSTYSLSAKVFVGRELSVTLPSVHVGVGADVLDVLVSGSTTECTESGAGTAFATCSTAATLGADADAPGGLNDVLEPSATSCNLTGTIARAGSTAVIQLAGQVVVSDTSAHTSRTFAEDVVGVVQYTPDFAKACGGGFCVTDAVAKGAFTGKTLRTPDAGTMLVAGGGFVFRGTADLEAFPCSPPPPYGTGPCNGTFSGEWTGRLSGVSGPIRFEVAWSAPGDSLSAAFQYAEWQCTGLETVLGFAEGTATGRALPGQVQGKWQIPGETFARDIIGVSASFSFTWERAGTAAVLNLVPFSMTVDVAGLELPQQVVNTAQTGAAGFVATNTDPIEGPPLCGTPLTHVQGNIAGAVSLAQASV
jgi:hypothetical protein